MYSLPTHALRALAAVYLTGGIRPAGRMLNVAHSSIARHLAELEARVGAPIVEKTKTHRRFAFTPLGETLGREAAEALSKLDTAWLAACEQRPPNGVVISAAPSFAALWLLPRLPVLSEAHPKIEVSVLAEQRVRGPEEEGCDITIRMGSARVEEKATPLMDDALSPVVSQRLLARARTARGGHASATALLNDLPLLHDRDPNAGWGIWSATHGPKGLDKRGGPRFASSDLVLRAAEQGQGVALARLQLAQDRLRSGSLVRLSESAIRLSSAYQLIGRKDRRTRHAVQAVWTWLLEEARRSNALSDEAM